MNTSMNKLQEGNPLTVAQLAVSNPGALSVFTKYNIDYCCGGHRSIEDACLRAGLDPEKVKAEIVQSSGEGNSGTLRPENWSSSFLADYIVQNHHVYVMNTIPEILALLDKVCDAHGNDSIELLQIREAFIDLSDELTSHMKKEEQVLFPLIKGLESQKKSDHPPTDAIQSPLDIMEHEHVIAGDLVKQIRSLSKGYTPPEFACPTFRITYKKLQEFDNDLMRHIHLENNILFLRVRDHQEDGSSCAV